MPRLVPHEKTLKILEKVAVCNVVGLPGPMIREAFDINENVYRYVTVFRHTHKKRSIERRAELEAALTAEEMQKIKNEICRYAIHTVGKYINAKGKIQTAVSES